MSELKTEQLDVSIFQENVKEIKFKDGVYKIPDSIPTLLYLELLESNQDRTVEGLRKGMESMYKIFQIHQPEMDHEKYMRMMTSDIYAAILNWVFAGMSVEETMKILRDVKEELKDTKKKPLQAS